jgi:hypothetical protein
MPSVLLGGMALVKIATKSLEAGGDGPDAQCEFMAEASYRGSCVVGFRALVNFCASTFCAEVICCQAAS